MSLYLSNVYPEYQFCDCLTESDGIWRFSLDPKIENNRKHKSKARTCGIV